MEDRYFDVIDVIKCLSGLPLPPSRQRRMCGRAVLKTTRLRPRDANVRVVVFRGTMYPLLHINARGNATLVVSVESCKSYDSLELRTDAPLDPDVMYS
jgi:hypothetical protein